MSDAPLNKPLLCLANFLTILGAPPSHDSMEIWTNRTREQGLDVSGILALVSRRGGSVQEQASRRIFDFWTRLKST